MTYRIHRLNFGSVVIDESMRLRGIAPGHRIAVPAQGFLLEGEAGPILVDAGYRDPSVLGAGGEIAPGQGFEEQLGAHGLEPGDLTCVILTHLHRDHAGHLHRVPMTVPVVVNRSELGGACTGIQGRAYAKDDLHHLIDRLYTPGALRFLDLDHPGAGEELFPGVTCRLSGGHTPGSIGVVVDTGEGEAYLCGDLFYDVEGALRNQPRDGFVAGVQPTYLAIDDPALTNNFTTSVLQEMAAAKAARQYRFVVPAHDDPGVLDRGRYVGRILGDTVPGPVTVAGES
ncbi:N-acyl homoserine lactonase family protein [Amycolatopsis thermophila]|uniref:Glyoxylase-like metal-dependent hydrolase (Beta-lactamase superfamily II) n=1 Tax=Amycolatopsis thermophila TaxID=206084 RepID=A0ABU0ELL4_9PSEU|nr:N-acyl homoserine lactonase family protein [Amycolatopsis thermophila]MDQ0376175.1 glyoxylase-like metal-dependent hydrolase (beta-lactamase superfamily II) [Amycolatopsis thermophila]